MHYYLVNISTLRTIYFLISESHLNYCSFMVSESSCNWISLRIINFQPCNSHSSPLFKKVLFWNSQTKLIYKTLYLSVNPSITFYLLFSITGYFHLINTINYETSWSSLDNFISLLTKLTLKNYTDAWNNSQKFLKIYLRHLLPSKIKKILSHAYFPNYWNELSSFRYFKSMLDNFSNFASSIAICFNFFSLLLFYDIHFLPGFPSIYWTKLLLLSTQLLLHEIVPIQS